MCTLTSTWTPGIASPSPDSPQRRSSTASSLMRISVTRTTPMRKRSGRPSGASLWETTATSTAGQTCSYWQMAFETFRKTCLKQYGLDPAHYYTRPGLSWDALLKKTGVELQLLTEVEQLVPNHRNKDRYVLHYRNLQLYMSLGMRLTEVHRALRFDQRPWMEPYIRMNTELRRRPPAALRRTSTS